MEVPAAGGSPAVPDTNVNRWPLLASCAGLLADSYDIFTIDLVILILGIQYGDVMTKENKSLVVSSTIAGIIVGQLGFGLVGDILGRKWAFVTTAGLTVVGTLLSACVADSSGSFGLVRQLALCRFILGLGIGGEYPLSASVMTEGSDAPSRGIGLATVISMQGWGMLLSSVVCFLGLSFTTPGSRQGEETMWRMLLAFGALPSLLAFALRWQLEETRGYTEARTQRGRQSLSAELTSTLQSIGRFGPTLFGTSASWLLANVSLYSLGCFKSQMLPAQLDAGAVSQLQQAAAFNAVASSFALLGFFAATKLIDSMGRYWMQLTGFIALAAVFLTLFLVCQGSAIPATWCLWILLGLAFFFQNFGPNTTTYVVAAEAFPTLVRGSCHGISAACGKLGALLGTSFFPFILADYGLAVVYLACSVFSLIGAMATYNFTPRSISDLTLLDTETTNIREKGT